MEIKDNRALFKQAREEKEQNAETCRACGSKEVHTYRYGTSTPDCVAYLRSELSRVRTELAAVQEELATVEMELEDVDELDETDKSIF